MKTPFFDFSDFIFFPVDEIAKLQQRLSLLREEYVKVQKQLEESERDRERLKAQYEGHEGSGFVPQILKTVALLYNNSKYR